MSSSYTPSLLSLPTINGDSVRGVRSMGATIRYDREKVRDAMSTRPCAVRGVGWWCWAVVHVSPATRPFPLRPALTYCGS
jgi:hypothetical protein